MSETIIAIIAALGGGTTALAVIAWLRERGKDEVDVAERWEKLISGSIDSITKKATEVERALGVCQTKCAELTHLIDDMISDAISVGCSEKIAIYRDRLRTIRTYGESTSKKEH